MRKRLIVDRDVAVRMRDGNVLQTDDYRPVTSERYPVLLQLTPHGKGFSQVPVALAAAERGYAMETSNEYRRFNNAQSSFLASIINLNDDQVIEPGVEGIWSLKDLVGHLAAWENAFRIPLQEYAQSGIFQPQYIPDHDIWNAEQAAQREEMSYSNCLEEWNLLRREIDALLSQLEPSKFDILLPTPWGGQESLLQMLDGLAWHIEEHLKSAEKWLNTNE